MRRFLKVTVMVQMRTAIRVEPTRQTSRNCLALTLGAFLYNTERTINTTLQEGARTNKDSQRQRSCTVPAVVANTAPRRVTSDITEAIMEKHESPPQSQLQPKANPRRLHRSFPPSHRPLRGHGGCPDALSGTATGARGGASGPPWAVRPRPPRGGSPRPARRSKGPAQGGPRRRAGRGTGSSGRP